MNAEEAAKKLYPPEDGSIPGVDRNEHARFAFLRGVEWQKGALQAESLSSGVVHQAASAEPAKVRPELAQEVPPSPPSDPVTDELHEHTKIFQEQNRILREISMVLKARH